MSLHKLSDIIDLADPIKMFVCTFFIVDPPKNKFFENKESEKIELRAQTFTWPQITGDKTICMLGGFEKTYGGKQTRAGDWTVVFNLDYNVALLESFMKWVNAYHQYIDGNVATHSYYMANINVSLVTPELYGNPQQVEDDTQAVDKAITLIQAYPTMISGPQISVSSSEPINLTVTFHYNHFLMAKDGAGKEYSSDNYL